MFLKCVYELELKKNYFQSYNILFSDDDFSFLFLYTRKKFDWNYFNFTVWSIFRTPISIIGKTSLDR